MQLNRRHVEEMGIAFDVTLRTWPSHGKVSFCVAEALYKQLPHFDLDQRSNRFLAREEKLKMRGGCQNLVICAILGIVYGNCGEFEDRVPLRFCPHTEGAKLNCVKFCGPDGFLRYCCPSKKEEDDSPGFIKAGSRKVKNPPKNEEVKSIDECDKGETCIPFRFCSLLKTEKPDPAKFCGSVGFYRYCCPSRR